MFASVFCKLFRLFSLLIFSGQHGTETRQMNLRQAEQFNTLFIDHWMTWLEGSPWKDDPILTDRFPVALSVKYGQNIPICVSGEEENERTYLLRQRKWGCCRFVTFAIASHVR
jgi:hypothetical protein